MTTAHHRFAAAILALLVLPGPACSSRQSSQIEEPKVTEPDVGPDLDLEALSATEEAKPAPPPKKKATGLEAARNRGLTAALTVSRGPNAGKLVANIRDDVRSQIVARGRERELCYLLALTTGLRRGELASLTIADVTLNSTAPCLTVRPENEKARRGASVPLRADVASELSFALEQRLAERQASARKTGEPLPLETAR